MNIKKSKKILFILIGLIVIFFIIYFAEGEMISSINSDITDSSLSLTTTENELNSKMENLNSIQSQLEENNTKLKQLKSGDKYNLHDPTMQEVTDFLSNAENIVIGDSSTIKNLISNSKNQGIRCSYVILYMEDGDTSHLIGFDTIDKGMVCFYYGRYKVIPKIGSYYYECVVDSLWSPPRNDIISDIVVIGLNGCEEENTDNTPVISFYIEPISIDAGDTAELHWVVRNARSVLIDNGIGYVGFTGSIVIKPETTTTYTLTATNGDKTIIDTAEIIVEIPTDIDPSLVGTWDLITITKEYAEGTTWVFKSDKTFKYLAGTPPFTIWCQGIWSIENDDTLHIISENCDLGLDYWSYNIDGNYLTLETLQPDINGHYYGGIYKKES